MTFQQLWLAFVARNPALNDEASTVTIKPSQLRKMLEQSYDAGVHHKQTARSNLEAILDKAAMYAGK